MLAELVSEIDSAFWVLREVANIQMILVQSVINSVEELRHLSISVPVSLYPVVCFPKSVPVKDKTFYLKSVNQKRCP